jgi:uncharacterized repeat protein (TIGR02543 family)
VQFRGEDVTVDSQSITHGNHATEPKKTEREGYNFGGWFTDNATFANEWDFKANIITQDTTLYAKWEENSLQEINLQGTKWKLIGIVDVQTNDLTELEPKDCSECYTLTFDIGSTFNGRTVNNVIMNGRYEFDSNTYSYRIIDYVISEVMEMGNGNVYSQILWSNRYFMVNDTYLYLYYNDKKNYLLFKLLEL